MKIKLPIILITLSLLTASAQGTRVFYDGFEDGTTNLWQQDGYHCRCIVVDTAADGVHGPYVGSKMARCNWDGTVPWYDSMRYESLYLDSINYTDEIFYRVKLRADYNLDRTSGSATKILRIFVTSPSYNDYITVIYDSPSLYSSGVAGNVGLVTYWGGAPGDSTGTSSNWHEVAYYFNEANGIIKVWHDGVLIRNEIGLNFNNTRWFPFYITSNWEDAHDAQNHVYFDEVEIFTDATTGNPTSGSMFDGTIQVSKNTGITDNTSIDELFLISLYGQPTS